jgi:hypothetical protein
MLTTAHLLARVKVVSNLKMKNEEIITKRFADNEDNDEATRHSSQLQEDEHKTARKSLTRRGYEQY